jgi:hypothetical protein
MDSLITATALALRGIALVRLGDLERAKALLRQGMLRLFESTNVSRPGTSADTSDVPEMPANAPVPDSGTMCPIPTSIAGCFGLGRKKEPLGRLPRGSR